MAVSVLNLVAELCELDLLDHGTVFFEFVQRIDDYDGYGADNAPAERQRLGRAALTSGIRLRVTPDR